MIFKVGCMGMEVNRILTSKAHHTIFFFYCYILYALHEVLVVSHMVCRFSHQWPEYSRQLLGRGSIGCAINITIATPTLNMVNIVDMAT